MQRQENIRGEIANRNLRNEKIIKFNNSLDMSDGRLGRAENIISEMEYM